MVDEGELSFYRHNTEDIDDQGCTKSTTQDRQKLRNVRLTRMTVRFSSMK